MSGALFDQEARDAIRGALDESLLVEAAAGTGKTTELVARVVNVLRAGKATVDGIVAVTFTKKAAGELKLRLRQALDAARRDAGVSEKRNLEEAIAHLEEARIGTIHAFCAEILRERPVEARVDPRFEELAENEALLYFERSFDRWMQQKLGELPEGLRRALLHPAPFRESRSAAQRLAQSAWKLVEWRDYSAPWRRDPFDRDVEIDRLLAQISAIADLSANADDPKDPLSVGTEPARAFQVRVDRAKQSRAFDHDVLEAQLLTLLPELARLKLKGRGRYKTNVPRDDLVFAKDQLIHDLRAFERRTNADLAAVLQQELRSLEKAYESLKAASGKLDFVDLLVRARDLLKGDVAVRRYFRERFQRIFIDEFQDTDPLQAEILLLLAADDPEENNWRNARPMAGKLFMVGDPKQSIYRFRRADVVLYQDVKDHLIAHGVRLVHLSHSFRANRAIQEAVNAAFQPEMSGDRETGQPMYVALHGGPPESAERPSIIAMPIPKPHDARGVNKEEISKSLPGAVGALIDWMVNESRWTVRDPAKPSELVPIAPRHIAILFRNYVSFGRDLTRPYSQALEARGVQHILVAGRSFHKRDEVETMRAALAAIEWPDDELAVFATFRGPLFAISDELLFAFKDAHGRLHPFRKLSDEALADSLVAPVVEALSIFSELHKKRNSRPIAETINELLAITRAHAGFAMRATGDQTLANVQRVIELARGFEVGGGLSFRGFVEHLDREADSDRSAEAPLLEEGAEGVRMMTVHAAKGLEFPVVILADINATLSHRDPDRYLEPERGLFATKILGCMPHELYEHTDAERARDRAEGVRLAYVAATRARDILVVPSVGLEERESWYDPLNRAIYPKRDDWRTRTRPVGCPIFFSDATIVGEPPQISGIEARGVMPGLHQPRAGGHRVVWWDPHLLKGTAPARYGLRNEPLLGADVQEVADATLAAYDAWKEQRAHALSRGEAASLTPFAASEPTAPQPPPGGYAISELHLPREAGRPSGTRFGTLVHTVLRDVALDADVESVRSLAELHGRMLGASKEEQAAAVRPVLAVLHHSVLQRAQRALRCHREMPILFASDAGALLDGNIDLCFLEAGAPEWIVVDFKTDFDPALRRTSYVKQMKWYVAAVARTFGAPARGILLSV